MRKYLITPTLLFEMELDLPRWKGKQGKDAFQYDKKNQSLIPWESLPSSLLPHFSSISDVPTNCDVNFWWSEAGVYLQLQVFRKSKPLMLAGPDGRPADGIQFWIDTRCSPHIHRATKFCHRFRFIPAGWNAPSMQTGAAKSCLGLSEVPPHLREYVNSNLQPIGLLDEIPRARQLPDPVKKENLLVHSGSHKDGYLLQAMIPATCLTGYSPIEFNRISLFYEVFDKEFFSQTLSLTQEFRYAEDPSLWVACNLV